MTEVAVAPESEISPDSARLLEAAGRLDESLARDLPEYRGSSVYGSTSRGEAAQIAT